MASRFGVIEQTKEGHNIILMDFQKVVYLTVLDCLSVVECVPTGSGKTYWFTFLSELFSFVHKEERPINKNYETLIILPLSSMMLEQASRLSDLGIDAKFIRESQYNPLVKESVVQGRSSCCL